MVEDGGYFAVGAGAESLNRLKQRMEDIRKPSIVALIPARAGSKRVPNKNIRPLGGKSLLAWAIEAAQGSGIFSDVYVCTDSTAYGEIADLHGASVIPRYASLDDEPDIVWISNVLVKVYCDAFAILRPTSPFRTAETIKRAWHHFLGNQPCDSLRAVEPAKQHPGKMWVMRQGRLLPLLPWEREQAPWHSSPIQSLPQVYVQNASLEIAWTKTIMDQGTIAGTNILPFFTEGLEGYDINDNRDIEEAERIVREKGVLCR